MIEIDDYVHIATGSKEEKEEVILLFESFDIPYYDWEEKNTLVTDIYFADQIYTMLEDNMDNKKLSWR